MRKATDIRVVRTQNALLEALEELIKTKKLSCISITELCSKAGINRNTFYYHYNNIYELLDENKQMMIDELTDILTVNKTSNKEALTNLCKCIKKHPTFLNILISPNCDIDYFNDIFSVASENTRAIIENRKEIKTSRDYLLCYYCNAGCNAVITNWIRNGMQESTEEIADIITDASIRGPIALLFNL